MVEQETLRQLLLEALARRGYELGDVASLVDGEWRPRKVATETSVLVMLRSFEVSEFIRGAAAFVTGLDADARDTWYRAFTRTSFLVGDHERIHERFAALLSNRTSNIAWAWSPTEKATLGLRRLLKPLRTSGSPDLEPELVCDLVDEQAPAAGRRQVWVATGGVALEEYLVHLNHTLCEGLITGVLSRGDRIALSHVPAIESLPPECDYVRVVPDPGGGGRLKPAAYISSATDLGAPL
jgi:hypothetical protein